MAETTITYNDVEIKNVLTESINQTLVRESTQTDPLYVQITVSCVGLVHTSGAATKTIGHDVVTDDGAVNLASGWGDVLLAKLLQPRRQFIMQVGSGQLFNIIPGATRPGITYPRATATKIDVNHGPITEARILQIVSSSTMRVQFQVTLCVPYCDSQGDPPDGVISFRFWIADDIDCHEWITTRVYHGRLRVSDLTKNVFTALRDNFAFPPLQNGFVRESIGLRQSNNGLELEFTVRDKEVWATPPEPATHWDGYYEASSPVPGGAWMMANMYVHLGAPKKADKRLLLRTAARVLDTKLHYTDVTKKNTAWLQSFSFRESLKDNSVEGSMTLKQTSGASGGFGVNGFTMGLADNGLGMPLDKLDPPLAGYNSHLSPLGSSTATIKGLFLAFLNDPCHVRGFPQSGPSGDNPIVTTQRGQDSTDIRDFGQGLDQTPDGFDDTDQGQGYNHYTLSSDIDFQTGSIALPTGRRASPASRQTVAILQLHNGYATRRVRIEAERIGNWPTLPKPESFHGGGLGHTLLSAKVYPSAPRLDGWGLRTMYHVVYELVYVLDRVPDYSKDEIPAGLAPYRVPGQANVFVVPASVFVNAQGYLYR